MDKNEIKKKWNPCQHGSRALNDDYVADNDDDFGDDGNHCNHHHHNHDHYHHLLLHQHQKPYCYLYLSPLFFKLIWQDLIWATSSLLSFSLCLIFHLLCFFLLLHPFQNTIFLTTTNNNNKQIQTAALQTHLAPVQTTTGLLGRQVNSYDGLMGVAGM